jgi:hypothetical protein
VEEEEEEKKEKKEKKRSRRRMRKRRRRKRRRRIRAARFNVQISTFYPYSVLILYESGSQHLPSPYIALTCYFL